MINIIHCQTIANAGIASASGDLVEDTPVKQANRHISFVLEL
jgi:hypothetical protein